MGIINQGILGPISGKVGPVVGGSWKGIAYLRGYQGTVAQPNTAAQVAQKTKMGAAVFFAKLLLTVIIKPLNDRWAVHMSGYNLWISRNIEHFSSLGVPDYPNIVMSEGSLDGVDSLSAVSTDSSTLVTLSWVDNTGTGSALGTDEMYAVVYNATQETYQASSGVTDRQTATLGITMPTANATNDELHVYGSFRSANGFKVSDSSYYYEVTP